MSDSNLEKIHGTCVEVDGLGVLLCGPSGSGKSDLALRLIDEGARLIADDYTELSLQDGVLSARAPETIRDLIEVRGLGVVKIGAALQATLGVVIDLVASSDVERLAEDDQVELLGLPVARFRLAPFEASTPAKVRLVVRRVKGDVEHVP
ncbi:MAG: serine/threonine protein kinase [Rhodospirillales bacterium]|nr:serine/threonine protein kinase [Rhodospirillales bacterium]